MNLTRIAHASPPTVCMGSDRASELPTPAHPYTLSRRRSPWGVGCQPHERKPPPAAVADAGRL